MKLPKNFSFPKKLLTQINECSLGGFILFTFDKNGVPEINSNFDNPQSAMAMQYFMINWMNAIEQVNQENTIESIRREQDNLENGQDGD